MRLFHAELVSNPGYYGFGYSVYAELEPGDRLADAYAQGLVPFVGARNQPSGMLYMVRSSRIRVAEYREGHYQRYAAKKAEAFSGRITVSEYLREKHPDLGMIASFMLAYFRFRFGRSSMPPERLDAILACPLLTHIVEYRLDGELVGCTLETRTEDITHLWYYGYAKAYEKKCLGLHVFTDFVERSKARGDRYAYLGSTYGSWMRYKAYYRPLEYWDGQGWVDDPKGTELKRLLAADSLRQVAFSDLWREARGTYYPSPYPFASLRTELRFLTHLMYSTPRIFAGLLVLVAILAAAFMVGSLR